MFCDTTPCSRRRFLIFSTGVAASLITKPLLSGEIVINGKVTGSVRGTHTSIPIVPRQNLKHVRGKTSTGKKTQELAERLLQFRNLHTGEKLKTVYWADGDYLADSMREIEFILRDHRTGDKHVIDTKLLDMLHILQHKTDNRREFHVISGYRSPKTNSKLRNRSNGVAKRSMHMLGKAIDIRLPGTELKKLRLAALSMKSGGVGYYPKSNFIHVDTGRTRHW